MSFIEFLLEYYIYILTVLVILIIGVIGFLVDSKNKEKKEKIKVGKKDAVVETNSNNDGAVSTDNVMVNVTSDAQVNTVVNNALNNVPMEPQVQNDLSSVNQDNMSNQAGVTLNQVGEGNADLNPNGLVSNDLSMGVNNVEEPQMGIPDMNVNQMSNINTNIPVVDNDILGMQPQMVNNVQNISPVVEPMNSNVANTPVMENPVNMVPNLQPVMQPDAVNQFSMNNNVNPTNNVVQDLQPEVIGSNVNPVPVTNVNVGNEMVNNLNNNINVVPNVQPVIDVNPIDPLAFNPVNNPVNNVNPVQPNNMQPVTSQVDMLNNQTIMNNNVQPVVEPNNNIQNNTMTNPQTNNTVFTSDGSQPFDISSMFANNQ